MDLNVTLVKNYLENVTGRDDMDDSSVLLFNAGAHYVKVRNAAALGNPYTLAKYFTMNIDIGDTKMQKLQKHPSQLFHALNLNVKKVSIACM